MCSFFMSKAGRPPELGNVDGKLHRFPAGNVSSTSDNFICALSMVDNNSESSAERLVHASVVPTNSSTFSVSLSDTPTAIATIIAP